MPRFRLTLAYDGTEFHGWQKQEPPRNSQLRAILLPPTEHADRGPTDAGVDDERVVLRTVQEVVERAVREVVHQPVALTGASRTDSGVHARFQTASFFVPEGYRGPPDERMVHAINARLPGDVLAIACVRVEDEFDPVFDCLAKGYTYALHASRTRPLWDRRYVHHCWADLNAGAMDEAARVLLGEHDFAAFAAAGHGRGSTRRTIVQCRVRQTGPERVCIDVAADGFLWNMVRIIAGTLEEVGRGRKNALDVRRALESGDRTLAGPTLAPEGLCLEWAHYPGDAPGVVPEGVVIPGAWAERVRGERHARREARRMMAEAPTPAPGTSEESG